ncbi:hypothetical protein [Companilactobacillus jidongensis]|uniref:hypothetical protein n=1 Tax=Companilactobacillus jidongensis TaxID=2486006 RepID=UPI000F78A85A|nr:hypothetical protein [Companilactobacillus jidongensis]
MTKKYSLPQLLGFAIMIITNGAAILTVFHIFQNSALLLMTSRSLIMSVIGLITFVGYSLLQLLIYFAIVKLNQNDGGWAVVLLLIGIINHLYWIPALWSLIVKYVKQFKQHKNRPIL